MLNSYSPRCVMSGADVEVYLSQVHDGSVSSGFRALYEERLLLDVTLLIEEHHFQVQTCVWLNDAGEEQQPVHQQYWAAPLLRCVHPVAGPQGASGHAERLLPGHVHSRHEGEGPGQDPHEGADGCWVRPHPQVHVLRLVGAQHAHCPGDFAGNAIHSVFTCYPTVLCLQPGLKDKPLSVPIGGHVCPAEGGGGVLLLLPADQDLSRELCWGHAPSGRLQRGCGGCPGAARQLPPRQLCSPHEQTWLPVLPGPWETAGFCLYAEFLARQPAHFCRINHTINKTFSSFN